MYRLLFLFILVPLSGFAQPKQGQALIDSLIGELPRMKEDTAGVNLLKNISFAYGYINPDEGLRYAAKELALAKKIGWKGGEAGAYSDFGINYLNKSAYPEALGALFKALHLFEEIGNRPGIRSVSVNIGTVYWRQKQYDQALSYLFKVLKGAEEAGAHKEQEVALANIGAVYLDQKKYDDARIHSERALRIAETRGVPENIMYHVTNIGAIYSEQKKYPEALSYAFRSLNMARQLGARQIEAINLGNIGEAYFLIARDSSARIKPDSLVPAGRDAQLRKAIDYLQQGIAVCREIHYLEAIPEFSEYLSMAYEMRGDHRSALEAFRVHTVVKDSIFSSENNEKISNLETKRAIQLKDKDLQIARLAVAKKRNERWFFIGGIALLLAIMGILLRSYKRQQKANLLLTKEKQRSDDLLLNILPAEVAEELKESGTAHARQYEEVSVLFTDFVDFTIMAEQLGPQELVRELNECFTAFDAIIVRNGLEKIKTIGDAYLAVCGLPVSHQDHARKTVLAAMEIRDFIEHRRLQGYNFEIRIGINSGSVVAGIVGIKKFAYDIWGDTVNTAARMEQHGEPGRINISVSTYELVKDHFACTPRGMVVAKHKGQVAMYFVEAPALAGSGHPAVTTG